MSIQSRGMKLKKTITFGGKLSFILSFVFPERLHLLLHIFFAAPNCTTTIINLKPRALNPEFQELSAFHTD
jgi:hypothetical protein